MNPTKEEMLYELEKWKQAIEEEWSEFEDNRLEVYRAIRSLVESAPPDSGPMVTALEAAKAELAEAREKLKKMVEDRAALTETAPKEADHD
jgi:hypothetical protein